MRAYAEGQEPDCTRVAVISEYGYETVLADGTPLTIAGSVAAPNQAGAWSRSSSGGTTRTPTRATGWPAS